MAANNHGGQMQQPAQVSVTASSDHVAQAKMLVQQLKESLANLMRISSVNINHSAQIDTGSKTSEGRIKFEKALEDFFAITNQIERLLRTISECVMQQKESNKYMPFGVDNKLDASGSVELAMPVETTKISYNQYINIVKSQTAFAQSIQEVLIEGANKISHNDFPSSSTTVAAASAATS